jgi:PmbA protein
MRFEAFREKLCEAAAQFGYDDWELYFERGKNCNVRVFQGQIVEYKNAAPMGLCFRGVFQSRMGYAFTERLDEAIIPALLQNASENAAVIESQEREKLYAGDREYPNLRQSGGQNIATEKITELALLMEKTALQMDPRVKAVHHCNAGGGEGEIVIVNSHGLDLRRTYRLFYASLQPAAEENGVTKTWAEIWQGAAWDDFSAQLLAETAVRKALSYLPAQPIPSETLPVILSAEAARALLSAFVGVFFAENAQKGFSLLKDKTGETIASPLTTLCDDSFSPLSVWNAPFDSEGVACRDKIVVEKGVLKTLLYNLKSAEKDGVKSTGNGFKTNFRTPVETACVNFYLAPSETPAESLRAGLTRGLLAENLTGLHSGANAVTGDFSLPVEGFLIENGKQTTPVEQITIAGNFFDLLKNITAVGNDLSFGMPSSTGNIGSPSILIQELRVAGK